ADLERTGLLIRPGLDPKAEHNGHIYAFRVAGSEDFRNAVLDFLKQHGIGATFHFVPLHSSPYGQEKMGYRPGDFPITERVSRTLIRLPLYPELTDKEIDFILEVLHDAFRHYG
ncbi:MAG: TDP-4-oxo-6-deoxy-D-glucose aminotransferase, partial [Chloroflexi bacterium]